MGCMLRWHQYKIHKSSQILDWIWLHFIDPKLEYDNSFLLQITIITPITLLHTVIQIFRSFKFRIKSMMHFSGDPKTARI